MNKNDRGISLSVLPSWNRDLAARHAAGVLEVFAHSTGYAKRYPKTEYCINFRAIRLQNDL